MTDKNTYYLKWKEVSRKEYRNWEREVCGGVVNKEYEIKKIRDFLSQDHGTVKQKVFHPMMETLFDIIESYAEAEIQANNYWNEYKLKKQQEIKDLKDELEEMQLPISTGRREIERLERALDVKEREEKEQGEIIEFWKEKYEVLKEKYEPECEDGIDYDELVDALIRRLK